MDRLERRWTFLTHHTRVLAAIARNPSTRLRDIAATCQITERTVQTIVGDLEEAGYLRRERVGRRSQYTLNLDQPSRHPTEPGLTVRALVELVAHPAHRHRADTLPQQFSPRLGSRGVENQH